MDFSADSKRDTTKLNLIKELNDCKMQLEVSNKKVGIYERNHRLNQRNHDKELKLINKKLKDCTDELIRTSNDLYFCNRQLNDYMDSDKKIEQFWKNKLKYFDDKLELKNKELEKNKLIIFNKDIVIIEYQKTIDELEEKIKYDKSIKLKTLIKSLREELNTCNEEMECKNKELEECKKKICDQAIVLNKYKKEIDEHEKEIDEYKKEIDGYKKEIDGYEKEIDEYLLL